MKGNTIKKIRTTAKMMISRLERGAATYAAAEPPRSFWTRAGIAMSAS